MLWWLAVAMRVAGSRAGVRNDEDGEVLTLCCCAYIGLLIEW